MGTGTLYVNGDRHALERRDRDVAGAAGPGADGDAVLEEGRAPDAAAGVAAVGGGGWDRRRAVSPAEQELVEGGQQAGADRSVVGRGRARARWAAVAQRQARPIREVVLVGSRVGGVVPAGELVERAV